MRNTTSATERDPRSISDGKLHGSTHDSQKRWELGTILRVDANTYAYVVQTEAGRTVPGVGRMTAAPGDVTLLPTGTSVLVSFDAGFPLIVGVVTLPRSQNAGTAGQNMSGVEGVGGSGLNQSAIPTEGNYRTATQPQDMMPGDTAMLSSTGNGVAALNGGMTVVQSSGLARMAFHALNDAVELFSRNYRHVTDMGEFAVQNENGRINMSFRGATDQRNEAGPDEERWTIKADLGSTGDVVSFELCTPQGNTLFKLHINAAGRCEIFSLGGVHSSSGTFDGGEHRALHTGDSTVTVGASQTTEAAHNIIQTAGNTLTTQAGTDASLSVGNDYFTQAIRDVGVSSGRYYTLYAQGERTTSTPAILFEAENGDWKADLSNGSAIDFTTSRGGVSISSSSGDINLTTRSGESVITARKVTLSTTGGDAVVLGGTSLASHVAKYEQLESYCRMLHTLLDSHTHPVTGATTGPPTVPMGPLLAALLTAIKSISTGVAS